VDNPVETMPLLSLAVMNYDLHFHSDYLQDFENRPPSLPGRYVPPCCSPGIF
jgi:hypothetical protein